MNERPNIAQIKAELAAHVMHLVGDQKLTDSQATSCLGVSDVQLRRLRGGDLTHFSIDDLIAFLNAFDRRVEVNINPTPQPPLVSIVEYMERIAADVPDEEWDRLPKDLAQNYRHYLYGAPKRD